ncbi:hypothetical protein HZH66_008919 [Vespula vulgaris]|uniref:Uncharacterized protein n=1 Tax=Vespula vulgaris TaxID=7454 RepID=A0A834JT36_VESVU|nr:hypothetical protein HZH66_008919 [Vespula vulgaris]
MYTVCLNYFVTNNSTKFQSIGKDSLLPRPRVSRSTAAKRSVTLKISEIKAMSTTTTTTTTMTMTTMTTTTTTATTTTATTTTRERARQTSRRAPHFYCAYADYYASNRKGLIIKGRLFATRCSISSPIAFYLSVKEQQWFSV